MIDAHRIAPTHSVLFGLTERSQRKDLSSSSYQVIPEEEEDAFESSLPHRRSSSASFFLRHSHFLSHCFDSFWQDLDDDDRLYVASAISPSTTLWTPLHLALAASLALLSLATAYTSHSLANRGGATALLGHALGKLALGAVPDLCGARRTALTAAGAMTAALLSSSLFSSSFSYLPFCMELCHSVHWPSTMVLLATHHRGNATGLYEAGLWLTALASRVGAFLGLVLHYSHSTNASRDAGLVAAAWITAIAAAILHLHVQDAPHALHAPQNPPVLVLDTDDRQDRHRRRLLRRLWHNNILPSLRHVGGAPTFWIVLLAHFGAALLHTAERFLPGYLMDTATDGALWHNAGTMAGLLLAGSVFARQTERGRPWLVARLYLLSIAAVYALCWTALPAAAILFSATHLAALQRVALFLATFGMAVPYYHIPPLVGATFGCDKGLFLAYTDGVASAVAAGIWCTWRHRQVDPRNVWAAIALGLVGSGLVLWEFLQHSAAAAGGGGGSRGGSVARAAGGGSILLA